MKWGTVPEIDRAARPRTRPLAVLKGKKYLTNPQLIGAMQRLGDQSCDLVEKPTTHSASRGYRMSQFLPAANGYL